MKSTIQFVSGQIFDQHTYLHKFTASSVFVRPTQHPSPNTQRVLKHQSKYVYNIGKRPTSA